MGRLLEALKRLEPELPTMKSVDPAAPADDRPEIEPSANQTAVLEPPAGWREDAAATIDAPEMPTGSWEGDAPAEPIDNPECLAVPVHRQQPHSSESTPPNLDGVSEPTASDCPAERNAQTVEESFFAETAADCGAFGGEQVTEIDLSEDADADCVPAAASEAVESQPFAEVTAEFENLRQLFDEELPPPGASSSSAMLDPIEDAGADESSILIDLPEHEFESGPENADEAAVSVASSNDACEPSTVADRLESVRDSNASVIASDSRKVAAAFGAMARNIFAQLPAEGSVVLFFTSPIDGEGKTETILPLAEALIEASGWRTILVDANLHRPDLTKEWRFSTRKGIFDVLIGEADWWDAVQETGLPKLSILLNNGLPQENAIVAQPLAFSELLENLKREYRLVLVDAASLARDESIPMIRYCQGVYLVVRLGHSTRRTVREARQVIAQAGGNLLGCIAVGQT
jgi:Mrp family chromosome partitioning ATPase